MRISVRQIYIEPGVTFSFSHRMQIWLSRELSAIGKPSQAYVKEYDADFDLVINLSARTKALENEIRGPTVFKRTKDVEYTLFLPYDRIAREAGGCRVAMEFLLAGVQEILAKARIHARGFEARRSFLIEHICSDPAMLKKPWP